MFIKDIIAKNAKLVIEGFRKACKPFIGAKAGTGKDIDEEAQKALKRLGDKFSKTGSSTLEPGSILEPGYIVEYDQDAGEPFYCFYMDLPIQQKNYTLTISQPEDMSRKEFIRNIQETIKDTKSSS